MEDLISRQAAIDTFGLSEKTRKYGGDHSGYDTIMLYEVQDALEALPSINPQKIGHWILTDDDFVYCSECEDSYYQRPIDASWYYCPHCGAKMVEPQESEVME